MLLTNLKVVTTCILAAGLSALALPTQVAAQTPAKEVPGSKKNEAPTLEELTKLAAIVKPTPEENKWQQVPWIIDVNEGRRLAKEEKRPILLWTIFGDPLDEC
jgi:hypothetical protein